MIQLPRFIITAPLAMMNLADSGNDWFKEFLFTNDSRLDIKSGSNLISYIDLHGTRRSFNGRLIHTGIKRSNHTEVLGENINIGNQNRVLFRLAHKPVHDQPSLLNFGLAIFEMHLDNADQNRSGVTQDFFVLAVSQDANNLSNINVECIEHIRGDAASFFKGLNNKHVNVIELVHSLISTTRCFAFDADKYELIAKKLLGELKGFYGTSKPKVLKVKEKSVTSNILCEEATLMLLFLDSQIEVTFKLNDYTSIDDAAYVSHEVKTVVLDDGSDYIKSLDFDALVKKHLDVDKVFEVLREEYRECNTPPL